MLNDNDALLIVDVQNDFLPGGALAVPEGDEVVEPLSDLAREFAGRGLPVVASRDWHPRDHCSFVAQGGPWPRHCVAATPGAEFDAALDLPDDTYIVNKATTAENEAYSAFDGTDLHEWLAGHGVKRLFIGGVATDYCVLESALDARKLGYDVVLLEDAIRAIDPEDGRKALETLTREHAKLADSDAILNA